MNPAIRATRGEVRALARWSAAGAAIGAAFCALWWALLASNLVPTDHVEELVIPLGTADAIARDAPFAFVPDRFSLPTGSRLRVVNADVAAHRIGGTDIPPGATADIEASESGELLCTIHPAGHLEIALSGRPPLGAMVLLVVGLSLATLSAGWVLR